MMQGCGCRTRSPQMGYYLRRRGPRLRAPFRTPSRLNGLGQDAPGAPAGAQYFYRATRKAGFIWGAGDISAIILALKANWSIVVDSSTTTEGNQPSVSMYVHALIDYARPADIQANIDHEIIASGRTILYSSIALVQPAPVGTVPPDLLAPKPPQGIGDWLSANWGWLALAGVGIVAAREVL
jgi:hypothetical protein